MERRNGYQQQRWCAECSHSMGHRSGRCCRDEGTGCGPVLGSAARCRPGPTQQQGVLFLEDRGLFQLRWVRPGHESHRRAAVRCGIAFLSAAPSWRRRRRAGTAVSGEQPSHGHPPAPCHVPAIHAMSQPSRATSQPSHAMSLPSHTVSQPPCAIPAAQSSLNKQRREQPRDRVMHSFIHFI